MSKLCLRALTPSVCFTCGKDDARVFLCAKCGVAKYCSRDCQIIDYKSSGRPHKERCCGPPEKECVHFVSDTEACNVFVPRQMLARSLFTEKEVAARFADAVERRFSSAMRFVPIYVLVNVFAMASLKAETPSPPVMCGSLRELAQVISPDASDALEAQIQRISSICQLRSVNKHAQGHKFGEADFVVVLLVHNELMHTLTYLQSSVADISEALDLEKKEMQEWTVVSSFPCHDHPVHVC